MFTVSSGAEVPNATMVRPTTSGEIPKPLATEDAPRTSHSAPKMRTVRPIAMRKTERIISV
jgi:hypothetical protein